MKLYIQWLDLTVNNELTINCELDGFIDEDQHIPAYVYTIHVQPNIFDEHENKVAAYRVKHDNDIAVMPITAHESRALDRNRNWVELGLRFRTKTLLTGEACAYPDIHIMEFLIANEIRFEFK
jgi:hypothetical protein